MSADASIDGIRSELERVRRVADMLCTGHAALRDRFARLALILDLSILGVSTWLVALVFVEPQIGVSLTPFGMQSQVWTGVLAIGTFFLTIIQMKTDFRGRSDAHRRTLSNYFEVKREANYLLAFPSLDEAACRRVLARYDMATSVGVEISESEFLRQKKRHETKIALSQHLDVHPSASLVFTRVKLWYRDNFGARKRNG